MDVEMIIKVDNDNADEMLERLERALSDTSLIIFLEGPASEYMRNEIVQRFAYEGDAASGDWLPLKEGTINIKRDLPDLAGSPEDINVRTGEMFNALTGDYPVRGAGGYVQLDVPGDLNDNLLERKLMTAQRGSNDNPIPGFGPTPPRPVLATSEMQLGSLLAALETHISAQLMTGFGF